MGRSSSEERARGFVTVSAGNHGQAVAWCARQLGSSCTVWVPDHAVEKKVKAIGALGATVRRMPDEEITESMTGDKWEKDPQTYIHPFGDRQVLAGQGTIGLEIIQDLPDVRTVVVPVGGGGLISGIAAAVKAKKPDVRVLGVQAEAAAPLSSSFRSGSPERIKPGYTFADGIAGSLVFDFMWPLLKRLVDGAVVVSDDELRRTIRYLANEVHVVAEGAGAAALAAAWRYFDQFEKPIACIVSGGNIDSALLAEVLTRIE